MTTARRTRAYIGLGANVGDAAATLGAAIHALAALPGVRLRGVSRLYATEPVGVTDQPEFRNAVVALDVPSGPDPTTGAIALLVALKALEVAFGRRARGHWGPRELDLDLLLFGRTALAVGRPPAGRSTAADGAADGGHVRTERPLVVPHPEAHQRLFVLAPLADLSAGLSPPGWGERVETARRRREAEEGSRAVRPIGRWDATAGVWTPLD
jgi:2-amino-4-hydroxy-6-hydroxymethyldihydropteridine diphosphokinase